MITEVKQYVTSDGAYFDTRQEAIAHEKEQKIISDVWEHLENIFPVQKYDGNEHVAAIIVKNFKSIKEIIDRKR